MKLGCGYFQQQPLRVVNFNESKVRWRYLLFVITQISIWNIGSWGGFGSKLVIKRAILFPCDPNKMPTSLSSWGCILLGGHGEKMQVWRSCSLIYTPRKLTTNFKGTWEFSGGGVDKIFLKPFWYPYGCTLFWIQCSYGDTHDRPSMIFQKPWVKKSGDHWVSIPKLNHSKNHQKKCVSFPFRSLPKKWVGPRDVHLFES